MCPSILSIGAHKPRAKELFTEEPKDEVKEKLPEKEVLAYNSAEPEKEVGKDSHDEKEKENSGYVDAQDEKEKEVSGPQDVCAEVVSFQEVSAENDPENDEGNEKLLN